MNLKICSETVTIETELLSEKESEIRSQIKEYLHGERENFDLQKTFPKNFTGLTMKEIDKIPYGKTKTYGEIAEKLDSSAVAVGQACGKNPIPLIVPCHRVTSKNGMGGYAYGQDMKRKLLNLEKSKADNRLEAEFPAKI